MLNLKRILPIALLLAAPLPGTVMSAGFDDDSGWYIAGGLNWANGDADEIDESDTTWSVYGGYMWSNNFGAQVGYVDLGSYSGAVSSIDVDAWELSLLGSWEFAPSWSVYGKLGLLILEANSNQFVPGRGQVREDQNEEQPIIGVGLEYDFGAPSLYAEWNWVDTEVNNLTVDMLAVGLRYRF